MLLMKVHNLIFFLCNICKFGAESLFSGVPVVNIELIEPWLGFLE